jgi:antitoxin (DNA-binding transcriptional repressor) of toxin-antitoxin stability system
MTTVTIEEAQSHLPELIGKLVPGEEILIIRNAQPIAKLILAISPAGASRQPGGLKDKILYMAEDFDAPLEEFREYMG